MNHSMLMMVSQAFSKLLIHFEHLHAGPSILTASLCCVNFMQLDVKKSSNVSLVAVLLVDVSL